MTKLDFTIYNRIIKYDMDNKTKQMLLKHELRYMELCLKR